MSAHVKGDRLCGRVAAGVEAMLASSAPFRAETCKMPLPLRRGCPFCGRVHGAEKRFLVSALKTWEVQTYLRAREEAAVAVIPRFAGGQQ